MSFHKYSNARIVFGTKLHSFIPKEHQHVATNALPGQEPFSFFTKFLAFEHLVFLKQVHDVRGIVIKKEEQLKDMLAFQKSGDYLITDVPGIGLATVTADCTPLIFYDSVKNVIANAHAGWRGSVAGIGVVVVRRMIRDFGCNVSNINVFIGPSAGRCCYVVGPKVLEHVRRHPFFDLVVQNNSFNLPRFNQLLLQGAGIDPEKIHLDYHVCTICDSSYCSVRRDTGSKSRQLSVITLQG